MQCGFFYIPFAVTFLAVTLCVLSLLITPRIRNAQYVKRLLRIRRVKERERELITPREQALNKQ